MEGKEVPDYTDTHLKFALFYFDLQVADLYTVAVGIGNGINTHTLHDIAGDNGNVIAVESFDQLTAELSQIKDKVCGTFHFQTRGKTQQSFVRECSAQGPIPWPFIYHL